MSALTADIAFVAGAFIGFLAGRVSARRSQAAHDAKLREGIERLGRAIAEGLKSE